MFSQKKHNTVFLYQIFVEGILISGRTDKKTISASVFLPILSKRRPHTFSMTMVKIKFLLLPLNRLELIVLQSKENVVGKKIEKRSLFLISQLQLLELLTQAFFFLAVPSYTSIIEYEDINIFFSEVFSLLNRIDEKSYFFYFL